MTTRKMNQLTVFPRNGRSQRLLLYLPSTVSGLRLVALPLLVFSLSAGQFFFCAFFFLLAVASDLADGYLARRFGVSSRFGARFDASVDFVFIAGVFLYFVIMGLYPAWVFGLIIFMFAQFVVTSALFKLVYDPLGKYYGGFLYGAIGLTILSLGPLANSIIALLLTGITIVSLICRLLYLLRLLK